jgi:lantibiotic biosynthesis protein
VTFLETAERIGARLCRDAIWWDGRCNWIGMHSDAPGVHWHGALSPGLYSGTAGIALVLERLHRATGERVFRMTAEGALRQALSKVESLRESGTIGFHDGIAGIAYAAGDAVLARSLPPQDGRLDVINGSAGIIPALLALGERQSAETHARHLIERAQRTESGWSWDTALKSWRPLTGYGHGAAGIAYSLLEVFRVTGDAAYREAAIEGFRYEASVFDREEENWPDYRSAPKGAKSPCAVMWCAGAPGSGLALLRAYQILGDEVYRDAALAAIRTTTRWFDESADANYSLCHGRAGNAELLLTAGAVLDEPAYTARAWQVGEEGIDRYEGPRVTWPCGNRTEEETPGLMLGLAGIAYFYLRLHDPGRFPSVLLLNPHG